MITTDELVNLLARCAIKDSRALKTLFDETSAYLNRVAYNIVKSTETSQEVLQEAFIQIWENAASYRQDKAQPLTWMTSIVRYRALDRIEKENKHALSDNIDDVHHHASQLVSEGPEHWFELSKEQLLFRECLESLNDKIGDCIRLAYLQGYSREMISSLYDTKTNTIKSWLKRGIGALKQCIEAKTQVS